MNDFTSNLIARHERLGEFVKPRVRQKFEPEYTGSFDLSLTSSQELEQTRPESTAGQNPVRDGTRLPSSFNISDESTTEKNYPVHSQSTFALRTEQSGHKQPLTTPTTVVPLATADRHGPNGRIAFSRTGLTEQQRPQHGSGTESDKASQRSNNALSAKREKWKTDTGQGIQKNSELLSGLFERILPEMLTRYGRHGIEPGIAMVPYSAQVDREKRKESEQPVNPAFQPAKPVPRQTIRSTPDYQDSLTDAKGASIQPQKQSDADGLFGIPAWLNSYNNSVAEQRRDKTERPSEMVINVTIDRIEVRAIPSGTIAQVQKKADSARQVMSLEEYLKQRG